MTCESSMLCLLPLSAAYPRRSSLKTGLLLLAEGPDTAEAAAEVLAAAGEHPHNTRIDVGEHPSVFDKHLSCLPWLRSSPSCAKETRRSGLKFASSP
jgi:hypothetical protein